MSVSLEVGEAVYAIGSSAFLKSFFSTVFVRVEAGDWGSKFPAVMRELYSGGLPWSRAEAAVVELEAIRNALRNLPPEEVVWDFEDSSLRPPWGDRISAAINDLSQYFVTSDGKNLLDVLIDALRNAAGWRRDVRLR